MYQLHVVAISGGGPWQTGIVLWLLTAFAGGVVASLSGEWSEPDSLMLNLVLAGLGGALANLVARPFGTDLIAYVFGVRVLTVVAGAFLLDLLSHDAVYVFGTRELEAHQRRAVIRGAGGLQNLYTWLSGWPSGAAMVEAHYGGRLGIKLLEDSLHYQVRTGPLTGSETVPMEAYTRAAQSGGVVRVWQEPDGAPADGSLRSVELSGVYPVQRAEELVATITRLAADLEEPSARRATGAP